VSYQSQGNDTLGNLNSTGETRTITFYVCGTITRDLTLLYDVASLSTTCFTLAGANTLDCNGHTVQFGKTGAGNGVQITASDSQIKNCIIRDITSVTGNVGIRFNAVIHRVNITNVTTNLTGNTKAILMTNSNNAHNITNSRFYGIYGANGLWFSGSSVQSVNVEVWNSSIIMTEGGMYSGTGVKISAMSNVKFFDTNITAGTSYSTGVSIATDGATSNIKFINSRIIGQTSISTSSLNYDIYLLNTTVLGTFSPSDSATSNLTVQWYARFNITNSTGTPQSSAITVKDNLTRQAFSGSTDASGLTGWQIFNDTTYSSVNTKYNNHTINASYTGYGLNSTSYSFNGRDYTLNLTLYWIKAVYPPGRRWWNDTAIRNAMVEEDEDQKPAFNWLPVLATGGSLVWLTVFGRPGA
jgi:hypothetical protein